MPTPVQRLTKRIHALAQDRATELVSAPRLVPVDYYRDPSRWSWERDELLRSQPLVAAPSAQVRDPGDFHVRDVLGSSIIVTRDSIGAAHVLVNYCSHRASRVAEGSGCTARFICPYHNWSYTLDGELAARPRAADFPDADGQAQGLVELPSEERHGLIWFVPDPGVPLQLHDHLDQLDAELERWNYSATTYLDHHELDVAVNWKAGLENFADFYHVPFVHRRFGGAHVNDSMTFDRFGRHHRLVSGVGSLYDLSDAEAAAVMDDAHLVVAHWIFPSMVLVQSALTLDLIQFLPGADPARATMRHTCLARRPVLTAAERDSYAGLWEALSATFTGEDVEALNRVGEGLAHTPREHLVIGRNEPGVQNMIGSFDAAWDDACVAARRHGLPCADGKPNREGDS